MQEIKRSYKQKVILYESAPCLECPNSPQGSENHQLMRVIKK